MQDIDTKENDDKIARKIAQIQQRKERHAKRKAEKTQNQEKAAAALRSAVNKTQQENRPLSIGDTVRIKGLSTIGTIESIAGDMATAVFGGMRTKMRLNRLEHAVATTETDKTEQRKENLGYAPCAHPPRQRQRYPATAHTSVSEQCAQCHPLCR